METWYQLETQAALEKLGTDLHAGLEDAEAARRLEEHGANELVERSAKSPWRILWEQLTGLMVLILIISAGVSIYLREILEAVVILIIVVLNALLGFTQEYRAEQAMAALKKMAAPLVRVRRGGKVKEIPARELVPGDIILLEAGSSVPADARLIEAANLRAQEAVLTGESEPVEKSVAPIRGENIALGDQHNMLFKGTVITYGRGAAAVAETGMRTQLGRIADLIQSVGGEQTPLQRRLDQLGKGLALAALVIVAVVFLFGVLRGEDLRLMFQTAISMAVAAIPEGLPAVVTIALALGAQRMLRRKALIRKLPAVETLGSVTVICSDKTGTLTENRMTVTALDVADNKIDLIERLKFYSASIGREESDRAVLVKYPSVRLLLLAGTLCNDAVLERESEISGGFTAIGDPTEGALVVAAAHAGLWKHEVEEAFPRVSELPFDSDRKRMTTVHRIHQTEFCALIKPAQPAPDCEMIAFTKGAVDGMLEISTHVLHNDRIEPLDETWRKRILKANNDMAQNGMRVLGAGFQFRRNPENQPDEPLESGLVFIGMFGMIDPARAEVKDAVHTARTAGVRPIMITGDHPLTALFIARELGITDGREVITGQELEKMSVEQLKKRLPSTSVFARVSPEHKLKIVEALQEMGQIAAMTGDGVNDAPALKKANIGVAMGITGTDVSKEAADMVLLDDNFATIVAAIEEGRRIYDNIRKFIRYTLTSNAGEIWVMLLGPLFGIPLPLTPLQILWINLVTDGLPGLALTQEPAERNTMHRPPHPPRESIFGRGLARDVLWIGILMGLVSLAAGLFTFQAGNPNWQTMVFTTLTLAQMGNALAIRSDRDSLFTIGLLSNRMMLGSVLLTFLLQLAVIYVPFLQDIFKTRALTLPELGISLGLSVVVFFAIEGVKAFIRRRNPEESEGNS